jgi:hypothetical protein
VSPGSPLSRVPLLAVVVVVLAVLTVAAVVAIRLWSAPGTLASAIRFAPAGTERVSWTDWAAVRRELDSDVGPRSLASEVQQFLDRAFEQDLSPASALLSSAPVLQTEFGFSPATVEWELFSQGEAGAAVALGMGEDFDADTVADRLESLGYQRPDSDDTAGGTWKGGADLLPTIGQQLTPELQHVAVLGDEDVVLTSDTVEGLEAAVATARGDEDHLDAVEPVVERVGEPVAASVYTGSHACRALAMSQADTTAQAEGEALLDRAGEVNPMTGFAVARQPGGSVRFAMSFASEDQARVNAETRAALASGPAPGQGGEFSDRFTVESAGAEGEVVLIDVRPAEGSYVLSDLGTGPVLFATC